MATICTYTLRFCVGFNKRLRTEPENVDIFESNASSVSIMAESSPVDRVGVGCVDAVGLHVWVSIRCFPGVLGCSGYFRASLECCGSSLEVGKTSEGTLIVCFEGLIFWLGLGDWAWRMLFGSGLPTCRNSSSGDAGSRLPVFSERLKTSRKMTET
eukprot:4313-Amorphochlora_amoeboformis.AAC.3